MYTYECIYIYIYIDRERERENNKRETYRYRYRYGGAKHSVRRQRVRPRGGTGSLLRQIGVRPISVPRFWISEGLTQT